jgi:hypothetical protein
MVVETAFRLLRSAIAGIFDLAVDFAALCPMRLRVFGVPALAAFPLEPAAGVLDVGHVVLLLFGYLQSVVSRWPQAEPAMRKLPSPETAGSCRSARWITSSESGLGAYPRLLR